MNQDITVITNPQARKRIEWDEWGTDMPDQELTYVARRKRGLGGSYADVYYGSRCLATLYAPNRYEEKVHVIMVTTEPNFDIEPPVHARCISLYVTESELDHTLRGLASLLSPL